VRRREFITLLGGAAAAWPLWARAQQRSLAVVGFLSSRSFTESEAAVAAFRRALNDAGYVEGQNLTIEFRWAQGAIDRLPAMAADLVRQSVKVIFAGGGNDPVKAAAAATSEIPIVFTTSTDPVESGIVVSLNRPGGNVTGVSVVGAALEPKRFDVLKQLVPEAKLIAALVNPKYAAAPVQVRDLQSAAAALNQKITIVNASRDEDFPTVFAELVQMRADALMVATDVLFLNRRARIVSLAMEHALPAIYPFREWAISGGLMSYGPSLAHSYYQAGTYVARIVQGAKAADLPVLQPTKFELVINLKTAKARNIQISPMLLALADEVIE
jgi:putative ABC transport system substrate-binding protein